MNLANQEKSLGNNLGMKISNFSKYHDGFSFCVETELEAYKAAYIYRFSKSVTVKFAPNVNLWVVSIITKGQK